MSDYDFLTGEVSEPTTYTPVPTGKYQAKVVKAEMVDPLTVFGEPKAELSGKALEDYLRPFCRFHWQIQANQDGEATEYAGRTVKQRVSMQNGPDPKTGQSMAKPRADLVRVANGLKADDEVVGHKFIDITVNGLDKVEAIALANEALKKYEGLTATIAVRAYTSKQTGEARELVGGIVVPKE